MTMKIELVRGDDLVGLLRSGPPKYSCLAAANEIERLRAENEELRERLDDIWQGLQTVCGDVRAAIRECK